MGKLLVYLPPATAKTKRRIMEIRFFLFIKILLHYDAQGINFNSFLEYLADISSVSKPLLIATAVQLQNPHCAPTKEETVIAFKYMNVPIRTIQKISGITTKTYYKYINDWLRYATELEPQLDKNQYDCLAVFLTKMKEFFALNLEVLQYDNY